MANATASNLPAEWNTGDAEVFDSGGNILDKKELIGAPFLIGEIRFQKGDFGPFVSVTAVNAANEEFVFNDGSTGVYRQLAGWARDRKLTKDEKPESGTYQVRLVCKRGLRVSEYEGPGGRPARTYYLA